MTTFHTILTDDNEDYLLKHSQFDNKDIDFIFNSAYKFEEPHMQISKLQATSLQFFITSMNLKNIIEVGTFVGFSAFSMAKVQRDPRYKLRTIEINKDFYDQAEVNHFEYMRHCRQNNKKTYGSIENIEFINADAKDYLADNIHLGSKLDLMFVDGDKLNYKYYINWATTYLKSGGYMIIDNALFKGGVVLGSSSYAQSIKSATELLQQSNVFDYFFLTVGDCMIVARKR